MRKLLNSARSERGAGLVEYGIIMAVLVIVSIPAIGTTNDAVATALVSSVDDSVELHESDGSGGGGGGSATTTTTVPPTTTTTTMPPTTTTTTMPPTTTTTTVPPQAEAASYDDGDVAAAFYAVDGEVSYDSVVSNGWTYTVTKDTGTRIHLTFRQYDPDHKVVLKGFLNTSGVLIVKVVEKY